MSYDKSNLISAPWGGLDNSSPSMLLPSNSFSQAVGWIINKGRLQPFPALNAFTTPPDGEVIQGAQSFTDVSGFVHTGVMTKDHVYYLNNLNNYVLQGNTSSGGIFTPVTSNQAFSTITFLNRLFYANGTGLLNYLDGGSGVNVAGDVANSCFFLGKLSGSLLQLNIPGGPLTIQWSGVNNPLEWNSGVDITAGSIVIPEVEDSISGFAVQRGMGVVYRTTGITIMSPTGNFLPRFSLSSFNDGPKGVGVTYAQTLGNYGDVSVFVSEDDIYSFSSLQVQRIGSKAKKPIFSDLANASGNPWGVIIGKMTIGLDYLSYWLNIPQNNNTSTSTWVYRFDDQTWANEQLPYNGVRWMGELAIA